MDSTIEETIADALQRIVSLVEMGPVFDRLMEGKAHGRTVVRVSEDD